MSSSRRYSEGVAEDMKKFLYILFIGRCASFSMLSIAYLFSREEPLFFLQNIKGERPLSAQ
jgi:hypothetical protein